MDDHYETLQVAPSAEPEVIEAAYRRLARKYHPDVYSGGDANDRMQRLNAAYEVLSNPDRRADYDRKRSDRPSSTTSSSNSEAGPTPSAGSTDAAGASNKGSGGVPVNPSSPMVTLAAAGTGVALLVIALAIVGGAFSSGTAKPISSSAALGALTTLQATQAATNAIQVISAASVWQPNTTAMTNTCGRDADLLNPSQDQDCITQTMETDGASQQSMTFFKTTGNFLVDFTEEGVIDVGVIQAPWQNMDRLRTVLLNGPLRVAGLETLVPGDWQRDPRYLTLSAGGEALLLWPEYATASVEPDAHGGELVTASLRLSSCRACDATANLVVQATFDSTGALEATALLNPTAP